MDAARQCLDGGRPGRRHGSHDSASGRRASSRSLPSSRTTACGPSWLPTFLRPAPSVVEANHYRCPMALLRRCWPPHRGTGWTRSPPCERWHACSFRVACSAPCGRDQIPKVPFWFKQRSFWLGDLGIATTTPWRRRETGGGGILHAHSGRGQPSRHRSRDPGRGSLRPTRALYAHVGCRTQRRRADRTPGYLQLDHSHARGGSFPSLQRSAANPCRVVGCRGRCDR